MKISHYTSSLTDGGIASFLTCLVCAQSRKDEVKICTIFKDDVIPSDITENSVEVKSLNNPSTFISYLMFPFLVYKHIRHNESEVIHIHCAFVYYIIAVLFLHKKKKFFYTVHSDAFKEKISSKWESLIYPIKKKFFKLGWIKPVAISPQSEDSFYRLYGFHAKIINNGITLKAVQPSDEIQRYRNTPATKLFFHAGRISGAKNQLTMCRAFKRVVDDGEDVHLVIAGSVQDETIFSQMSNYWSDRITYIGNRSDVLSILKSSDFMLLPSIWEGLPITLLEAMSQGCIPVCSPVGGIPSVVENMKNGVLSVDSSEDSIFEVLKLAIGLSKEELWEISKNCQSSVREYSIEKTADEYRCYYQSSRE